MTDHCGICLEAFSLREFRSFPCVIHAAHNDCYKLWEKN